MNIIGINSARSAPARIDLEHRRELSDGGASLLKDGRIACAAIEERFTRTRYSGGFRLSLGACLAQGRISLNEIDAIGHSTCCDRAWDMPADIIEDVCISLDGILPAQAVRQSLHGKAHTIDHHESHAMLAFVGSGFQKSLVVIVDGMGNRLGPAEAFDATPSWWHGAFERHGYYICEWVSGCVRMKKVHEACGGNEEIGIGEIYRSVTHFLGWQTYQHAGKTMALAAFGNPNRLPGVEFIRHVKPFTTEVPLPNWHNDPVKQVTFALERAGINVPSLDGKAASPDLPFFCDVAALVQQQLEDTLTQSVSALAERHGVSQIAFGGGVAMNCVALGKLAAARPDLRIYVPPAPADTGQSLGNAMWLAYHEHSPVWEPKRSLPLQSAALGVTYSEQHFDDAVSAFVAANPTIKAERFTDLALLAERIADGLSGGKVIGLRQGRVEYGPRALGNASLIADPRNAEIHTTVNRYKRREPFRPYAPSILAERLGEYFEIDAPSPFMSMAGVVRPSMRDMIPAVVHVDGSARYQTVHAEGGFYRLLLETWHRRTGVPVILNTSFNINGEPIVETPEDALSCFKRCGIPALVLGHWHLEWSAR